MTPHDNAIAAAPTIKAHIVGLRTGSTGMNSVALPVGARLVIAGVGGLDGWAVGAFVGDTEGRDDGTIDGALVGGSVGCIVGWRDNVLVGLGVGSLVGAILGVALRV